MRLDAWMAGTSPAMTLGRQMSRRPFHPRGPAAGRCVTRNDGAGYGRDRCYIITTIGCKFFSISCLRNTLAGGV